MLTKKQANQLRGRLKYLLELAHDHAHAGAQLPEDAQYIRQDYAREKRGLLDDILALTEKKGAK